MILVPAPERAVLRLVSRFDGGDLEGDLREAYARRVSSAGLLPARAWLRGQVCRSVAAVAVHAARDLALSAGRGFAMLLVWYAATYSTLRFGFDIERPLESMPLPVFTLVWVFGGAVAAAYAAGRGRHDPNPPAVVVGVIAIAMLLLGVDEQLPLGIQALWSATAAAGAILGAGCAHRLPARML